MSQVMTCKICFTRYAPIKPNQTPPRAVAYTAHCLCHRGANSGQGCSAYKVCVCGVPGPSLLFFGSVSNRRAFDLESPSDYRLGKHSGTRVPVYLQPAKRRKDFCPKWGTGEQQAEGGSCSHQCVFSWINSGIITGKMNLQVNLVRILNL